jgi:hypothetical protein
VKLEPPKAFKTDNKNLEAQIIIARRLKSPK